MPWRDSDPMIFNKEEKVNWTFTSASQILGKARLRSVYLVEQVALQLKPMDEP